MIHVETAMVLCFIAFLAGMLLVCISRDEARRKLERQMLRARSETVDLRQACAQYERATRRQADELIEARAEIVILRGTNGPEAA